MKKKIIIVIATIFSIFNIVSFVFIKKPEFISKLFPQKNSVDSSVASKQIPPELQSCLKSIMNLSMEKVKADGQIDMQAILESCLTKGAKFPNGKTLDKETFEKMQEYYGTSLSKEDREMLQKLIEENGGVPVGTPVHSVKKNLTTDEIKKLNEQMQADLKKIPPEELEAARKANEDAVNNPQNYQGGSNGGMGL